ncbi:MAG TPA: VOC family protein, partial [Nitrososphaeraceae archaeon]|nr:VOC family protein [Nitrososphaeraceae archaeon]
MAEPIPVQGLFETHLTVGNLQRSIKFYQDIVGLQLAPEVSDHSVAFFWIGNSRHSMLGLWSFGDIPLGLNLHIAFEVAIDDLLEASNRLRSNGITPLSFFRAETTEPSVIGWMPAAAIYFRDPDNHLIEYLTMLDH